MAIQILLLFITCFHYSCQQMLVHPKSEVTGKLPNGLLLFIQSDKCQNDKLSGIIVQQTKTINGMKQNLGYLTEICPAKNTSESFTTKPPITKPTKPTGDNDCSAIISNMANATRELETIKVKQARLELQMSDLKNDYRRRRLERSGPCYKTFDAIGEAQIVHQVYEQYGQYGAWMKDPTSSEEKVWLLAGYSNVNQLVEFESEHHLKINKPSMTHTLPFTCDGTGHVVYKGAFYCNVYSTDDVARYDLKTQSYITKDYPTWTGRYYHSSYGYPGRYKWFLNNGFDLAVDENGLWLIFVEPNFSYQRMILNKLDPNTLSILQSWTTSVRKSNYGEAFVVCGKLFAVDTYNSASNYVSYSFDSVTSKAVSYSSTVMPFHTYVHDHRFSSLSYNYKERALYAWHYYSGSLVKYPLMSSFQ